MSSKLRLEHDHPAGVALLAEAPARVAAAVKGLSAADLAWSPREGHWAIVEHLWHLRDLEVEGFSVRFRRIMMEVNPSLPDIDGEKLAIERQYIRKDGDQALKEFAAERERIVAKARALESNELTRTGNLETVGPITLADLFERMVHHDREHVETITGIAQRILERRRHGRP